MSNLHPTVKPRVGFRYPQVRKTKGESSGINAEGISVTGTNKRKKGRLPKMYPVYVKQRFGSFHQIFGPRSCRTV